MQTDSTRVYSFVVNLSNRSYLGCKFPKCLEMKRQFNTLESALSYVDILLAELVKMEGFNSRDTLVILPENGLYCAALITRWKREFGHEVAIATESFHNGTHMPTPKAGVPLESISRATTIWKRIWIFRTLRNLFDKKC